MHAHEFRDERPRRIRVNVAQAERRNKSLKKILRNNNATHTTLIDEPRDTGGATIARYRRLDGHDSPPCYRAAPAAFSAICRDWEKSNEVTNAVDKLGR